MTSNPDPATIRLTGYVKCSGPYGGSTDGPFHWPVRGRLDIREIEDVGDLALNGARFKAATSDNPLVMDKIEADAARTKLERLKRAHDKGQATLAWTKSAAQSAITKAEDQLPALKAAIPRITSTAGENFTATIDGRAHTKRGEAVAAIAGWIRTHTPEYGNYAHRQQDYGVMGTLGGYEMQVRNAAGDSRLGSYQDLAVSLTGVPVPPLVFTRTELLEGSAGILARLENKVAGLPDYQAQLLKTVTEKKAVLTEVESQQGKPFKYEAKLAQARVTCAELDGKLKASLEPAQQAPPETLETADALDPALAQLRKLHAASFPAGPGTTRPAGRPQLRMAGRAWSSTSC